MNVKDNVSVNLIYPADELVANTKTLVHCCRVVLFWFCNYPIVNQLTVYILKCVFKMMAILNFQIFVPFVLSMVGMYPILHHT